MCKVVIIHAGNVMRETLQHKQAFDYYYTLGKDRNIIKVAQNFDVSRASVAKWSKAFEWQKRIKTRDKRIAKRVERITDTDIVKEKARYRAIIKATIAKIVTEGKGGNFKLDIWPENVSDLERLIKLDLLLMGEPTERVQLSDEERAKKIQDLLLKAKSRKKIGTGKSKTK